MNTVRNREQLTVEVYDMVNEVVFEIEANGVQDTVNVLYNTYEEQFEVSIHLQSGGYLEAIYDYETEVIEALSERYFS